MLAKSGNVNYTNNIMERVILHSDLNNFYASVECLFRPEYAHIPLAVSGNPEKRHGVILAKNAIAKKFGIKTGDVIWEAKNKCPNLVLVPPRFSLYNDYSKRVFEIYTNFTPFVEPFGPDECWLDCSGCYNMFGSPQNIAQEILDKVRQETGLTVSVGISFSKPLAKLCSDLAPPNGFFLTSSSDFKNKLWHLDVSELLMVGKKTTIKLQRLGINTIGDLACSDDSLLKSSLGINGLKIKSYALGTDNEPVRICDKSRKVESVGHGITAVRDICNYDDLKTIIDFLCEKISSRMINYGFKGSGVHVNLRTAQLVHFSRQIKLQRPIFSTVDIAQNAFNLSRTLWQEHNLYPLRSVSISIFDLSPITDGVQLSFFDQKEDKREQLELAIHKIRNKYGKDSVMRANIIGKDFIYDKNVRSVLYAW